MSIMGVYDGLAQVEKTIDMSEVLEYFRRL